MNKTLKKTLSIILTILMIVTSVPFAFAADETPPTRTIDGKTYYELDSADDLYWFAEQVNVNENDTINAILTADIVINENLMSKITVAEDGTATINEGETVREWTPIKYFINSDMVGYKGIFDGSNHTISGLYGNSDDMHYMGFFALANGATIKNLGIIDSYFYEYHNVASVVALARNTTIINCFSENCLIANESQRAGGIAGMLYNSNIIGCYNASTIRESGGGYYIGGIVGESVSTTISDCFNTGSIVATGDKVGGIVGCINSSSAVVENCYNIGKINSDSEKTGGIAGENWGSVIDCYFNSEIFSGSAIGNNEGSAVSSEGKTALQFASGEVAYAFGPAWGQKLGTDPYPVLGSTDTVYRVATYTKCDMSDVPVCEYNNTSGSDINNAPQHVLTGEITCMGELCEVCGKYYGDADESKHLLSWKTAKEATCAEPGLEIYDCEVCGNAPAMETVLCDSATYPESGHDYPSQANEEYAFSYPGATKLVITFSEDTETENNYDFIYIYDSTGTEYGKYSGTELAGVQIDLEGGSFKIKLTSDGSVNRYGFRLASVYATAPTAEYQREISALGHNWSNKDGICAKEDCGYECTHETYTNGKCDVCGYECTHESYTAGKCNACGYECTHESITDNKCDNCGTECTFVTIDMTDSFGDGWSGNAIVIKQFVDGVYTDTEAGTATIEYGVSGTFTTVLPKDGIFALSWLTGEYPGDCSFTIAVDGETVYECADGSTLTDGQMVYVTCEHTSYTDGKCDVCGYECTHKSYTDSKCDACGYICTHEGQNGSCQVCGANLGKLVIDVTDEQYVYIGSGEEYYDEDGYIITGTNQNAYVWLYESADLTLRDATFACLYTQYAPENSVVNITLEGTTEVTGYVSIADEHLIFDGDEAAIFKAPYFSTGGRPGSVTVNGGNIVLDYVTESYSHTIACNGGFIINGGTVTASNNFSHVVHNAVTLNGGELNVISTSADYAAIEETVTMKKGALLTVSAASGMLRYDSDAGYIGKIVMADGAEENDYFFVRYDTESEFVPVQDIESALNGKAYAEIKIDTHEHSYTDGICDCGYVCLHVNFADGICPDCTASGKLVAIKMSDSNNNGWYGKNAVVIKQLVDGAFEEVETATLTDGKSGTVAVNLDKDGIYVITWQSDYFSFECGFEIYVDGECVYSISDAGGIENNAILYTICEHTGGKADCLHRAVCEKCGNEYGEVDADGHIMEDNWSWHSSEQHMRGCTICHTSASYEYEDHYGGSATCSTLAICEGCGQSYGEYAADVHLNMSDWKPYSTEQHHRYCLDCGYGTEYADHVEPDNIEDIPCSEDALCKECGEKISSGYKHGPFEWKPYDLYQHQYVCDGCGGVTDYEPHNFIDSVCDNCGYECPHESYTTGICDICNYLCPHSFTEFTETVAPKCEEPGWEESYCDYCSIKLEQEIPALDHDWVSGGIERPYQNVDGSWTDGYYYDTCKNDGKHINITGVAKRADYSAYDEAYKSLKAAQKNANLTDAGAAAVNQAVMTGMTMPQNIVEGESTTAYLNNWVKNAQSILAKIENGEYLKADYTEIDEAIASVDTALENASISDEMTEELEDIKADLEALKENENATMADVNALLDRTEAIAETMNNCSNGVHSFTKYEEVTAPKCGVAGKEVAYCDNGCQTTDERETPALEHIFLDYVSNGDATCTADGTKTASCLNGCGTTDTVADEGSMLDHTDEDGDKLCDDCGEEVYDRCDICGGKAHGDDKIKLVFCMIITIIRFVTSILKSIN